MLNKPLPKGTETRQQQPASSIPEYAPRDIEWVLLWYLEKAQGQEPTPTATLLLTQTALDNTLRVFMMPHPREPKTGIVFPGGAINKKESPRAAALRETYEEVNEVENRITNEGVSDEFAYTYPYLKPHIDKAVTKSHSLERHFALTGRETRRGDWSLRDVTFVAELPKAPETRYTGPFFQEFVPIPQPPIPPIYPQKPYTDPNLGAHMVAWSLTQPNSSFFRKLTQIRDAINNLYPYKTETGGSNSQLRQLAEEVLKSAYRIEKQASGVYQLTRGYIKKYGNDLSVPKGPTACDCRGSWFNLSVPKGPTSQYIDHTILEQASHALLKQIKDLYTLTQFANLLHLTNQILRTMPLRYPADAVLLAMLSLQHSIGRYNLLPPQYIVYFPFGNPHVLVASRIPGTNDPILVTINKGTGPDSTSQRQRPSARIYSLRPATYFRLQWLFNNPH